MGRWRDDLAQALRGLRHQPAICAAVVATVAVAVGATTSVFSVVNGVLLRPLDYPEPDRLVQVWQTIPAWNDHPTPQLRHFAHSLPLSVPTFQDWQEAPTGLESMGITSTTIRVLQGPERAEAVSSRFVTSGIFEALGVGPAQGRLTLPSDDVSGAEAVAVVSNGFWQDRMGRRADVLGSTLILDGITHTVVGVMPARFTFPGDTGVEIWTSFTQEMKEEARDSQSYAVLARLRPGATVASVQAEFEGVQERLAEAYPDEQHGFGARVEGLLDAVVGDVRATLWLLLGAVGLVLAISCVNIANMLTVRGISRGRELAVRAALGAERGTLVRGTLLESGLLAFAGGILGIGLAGLALPALVRFLPPTLPRADSIALDGSVLLFSLVVTSTTALLIGVIPALLAGRAEPRAMLASTSRSVAGGRSHRLRNALVVSEVALSFVLLVGAGLLSRSFMRLWSEDRGFSTEGLAVFEITADEEEFPEPADQLRFAEMLSDRLSAIPGIRIAAANQVPLSGSTSVTSIEVAGPDGTVTKDVTVLWTAVMSGYFNVLEIPILEGRALTRADEGSDVPVAVINEVMAEAYWPGQSAVGQRLRRDEDEPWVEVVGVARNVRHESLSEAPGPGVYLTVKHSDRSIDTWVARYQGDPAPVVAAVRAALVEVSPQTPLRRSAILGEKIADSVAVPRFRTFFSVGLAGLATLLALLGVYGVMAFAVSQQSRELALRIALGARPGSVVNWTLRSGLTLCLIGLGVGGAVAAIASRTLEGFLYEMPRQDPLTYAVGTLVVGLVGLAASYFPARRAASIDPVSLLNSE